MNERVDDVLRQISAKDQSQQATANLALTLGQFWRGLIDGGTTEDAATAITIAFMLDLFSAERNQPA
jgi:hypothetical protein